ncbi:MAG: tRNA uridine-5-carboxymethylaminomethyl(34) synthesis GTPase MnmE, partial [Endomicrobium sp.]|nr:tRNA uridine-5-carboxymethylaminomethyl(34) synthesis GTPase MnmE [Endomicrobium sp.]
PVIINEVLNLLYKNGVRPAEPGEFTYRAFLNGKKDLAEAEAVCNLITSKTTASVRAALNNVSGLFSSKIKTIKDALTNLIAFMEVNLDHPEENIMFLSRNEKVERLNSYIQDIQSLLNHYKISKTLQNGIKVAIIGKQNVGKSSLLNAVLKKNRAIVTNIAGTTIDTIEETICYCGIPITIVDTAGIIDCNESLINPITFLGQKKTKEAIDEADILIWVFDSSSELDQNDSKIANFLQKSNLNILIISVLNKSDLPLKLYFDTSSIFYSSLSNAIKISAKTEEGLPNLLNEITKIADNSDSKNNCLMITSRHFALLQNVLDSLIRTRQILIEKDADEIACLEAVTAQTALNEILGTDVKQDILDTIFSTFCIGK